MSSILDSFSVVMGQLSPQAKLAQRLLQVQQSLRPISLPTFRAQMKSIGSLLGQFASRLTGFQSLEPEDREALLENNVPLYLQYLTARYLTSRSGLEQLTWILEGNFCQDYSEDVENLTAVSLEEFVWEQLAFRASEMFDIYSDYLKLV